MKTKIGRKSLALIAVTCGMAGCTRSEAPATPAEAPSAAAAPALTASADVITPGIYEVCDVADTDVHGTLMGDHLSGNKVEIRAIEAEQSTAVCIGKDGCPGDLFDPQLEGKVLWMIGDDKLLRTVHPFEHEPGKTTQPHLVKILNDPTDKAENCTKPNVLILRICQPHPQTKPTSWLCGSSSGPHGADAHIQN